MDRQIVYPGAIPLETDLLNTNRFAMIALAKLAMALLGSDTCLYGLHCTPDSTPSLRIQVGPGQIYSLENIDNAPYSSLAADTSQKILKQGLICESTTFELTAPSASGHSINYLVQVTYEEVDSDEILLPYYNAVNPAVAFNGPANSGKAQPGKRSGVCRLVLKSGRASPTGSQVTPLPDTGYVAAWGITVTAGMKAISDTSIFRVKDAPFLPTCGIYPSIQQCAATFAHDNGVANRYSAAFRPVFATLTDGMRLTFKAREANTGACTFSANGGEAYSLYSHAHQELQGGEIVKGGFIEVQWDSSSNAWLMCRNTGGATPVSEALKSYHAVSLGQADKRYLNNNKGYSKEEAEKEFLRLSGGTLSGDLNVKGVMHAESLYVGSVKYNDDGNIRGPRWKNREGQENGWLSEWILAQLEKLEKEISKLPSEEQIIKTCVTNVRLGVESSHETSDYKCEKGHVMTGWKSRGKIKKGYKTASRPLQVCLNGNWKTIESN